MLAAILGVPVSAVVYGFLALVSYLQKELFTHLPHGLGYQAEPVWWPPPMLAIGGALAALAIRYLPGRGGPSPAGGFKMHGPPGPEQLPGVIRAALATLIFGAVLGPEMPLILLGGGLAALAVRLGRRDVPDRARAVVASAGPSRWAVSAAARRARRCSSAPRAASPCPTCPGLPMVAGAAMGIGAMSAVMLTLRLTSVLLPVVLLPSDGLALTPHMKRSVSFCCSCAWFV